MDIPPESIKELDYFVGLNPEEIDSIKPLLSPKEVEKDEIFVHEGEYSDFLYFVFSGAVKVYKTSSDGKEQILHIAYQGESLNDVSTFDGGPSTASMLAMTPATLYEIRQNDIKAILQHNPKVAINAVKVLAMRVRRDSSLVQDLSFSQVIGRLAKMLLKRTGEEMEVGIRLTQQDMAAMVGTTREVVNRSLRMMEEKGAIRLERRGVVITDKEALKEMLKAYS